MDILLISQTHVPQHVDIYDVCYIFIFLSFGAGFFLHILPLYSSQILLKILLSFFERSYKADDSGKVKNKTKIKMNGMFDQIQKYMNVHLFNDGSNMM